MKYTNLTGKIGSFFIGLIYSIFILVAMGGAGLFLWLDLTSGLPMVSLLWILLLPALMLAINWLLGKFFGDEYYNTGIVSEGRTIFDVVKTPKYYKRRMYVYFVECALFILLAVRFGFLTQIDLTYGMIGILCSIIGSFFCFIIAMSSKEQSGERSKRKKKPTAATEAGAENIGKEEEKIPTHRFKFDKYPTLLEKYEAYRLWIDKKSNAFDDSERLSVIDESEKHFEALARSVYDIFSEIRPELTQRGSKKSLPWESVFDKPYEKLSYTQKLALTRLLDKHYKYFLPDKYYLW